MPTGQFWSFYHFTIFSTWFSNLLHTIQFFQPKVSLKYLWHNWRIKSWRPKVSTIKHLYLQPRRNAKKIFSLKLQSWKILSWWFLSFFSLDFFLVKRHKFFVRFIFGLQKCHVWWLTDFYCVELRSLPLLYFWTEVSRWKIVLFLPVSLSLRFLRTFSSIKAKEKSKVKYAQSRFLTKYHTIQ